MRLRLSRLALLISMTGAILLGLAGRPAAAIEIPPPGSPIYIQTNAPASDLGLGDWYTNNQVGTGNGYHYFSIDLPCLWPAATPIYIDLFSAEINSFNGVASVDEYIEATGLDNTIFELYAPGTPLSLPTAPAPGAAGSLIQTVYTPITGQPEQWVRFYTIPDGRAACGSYILRVQTTGDDQNSWRLRFGGDDDNDATTEPPANYDNPDGLPGTGDEVTVGITQTSYQQDDISGSTQCLTLYQYVDIGLADVVFHNYDLDFSAAEGLPRVRYYPPSATYSADAQVTPGSFAGVSSVNRRWNGYVDDATPTAFERQQRAGDRILNPESGWWRIVTCVQVDNQFIQEAQTGIPAYREQPPEPDMLITKTDAITQTAPGALQTYQIGFSNVSLTTKSRPGAAFNVVITDDLPPETTFDSCNMNGLAGSCSHAAGVVTFNLTDAVLAGGAGSVGVTVEVNRTAVGPLTNTATINYRDGLGNRYPPKTAIDIDIIPPGVQPAVRLTKTATIATDANGDGFAGAGDVVAYTVTLTNDGPGAAYDLELADTPDANTTLLVGSAALSLPAATLVRGNTAGDGDLLATLGSLVSGQSLALTYNVQVNTPLPDTVRELVNQATVTGSNIPPRPSDDPRTPLPDDPTRVPTPPAPSAVVLTQLRLVPVVAGWELRWATGTEPDSVGFLIYRSAGGREKATLLTAAPIPAQGGPMSGASYSYTDRGAQPGLVYTYWLVDVESSGARVEYGPVRASGMIEQIRVMTLPLVWR